MRTTHSRRRVLAIALVFGGGVLAAAGIRAADHRDSTLLTGNPSVDIADVYSFRSPTQPSRVVLAMTVDGFIPPAEAGMHEFERDALYQFKIDTNGDAQEDLVIQAIPSGQGRGQHLRVLGPAKPPVTGAMSRVLKGGAVLEIPVSRSGEARIATQKGITGFAGLRDDPFFFDLTRFQQIVAGQAGGFRNPGIDAFAGFNVLAIVLELPAELLGDNPNIRVWGTTSRPRTR